MDDFLEQLRRDQEDRQAKQRDSLYAGTEAARAQIADEVNAGREEWAKNRERYAVSLPQEQYEILNNAIANSDMPEDEAYRWATALEFNRQLGVDLAEAYQNVEKINAALWGENRTFVPKTNFKAICDYGKLGTNTLRQGAIGSELMIAEMSGDEEKAAALLKENEAIERENESLADNQDRNLLIEALKMGAQSAPFTGYVAGVGLLGSVFTPAVGTAAAFAASMQNAQGLEYLSLRKEGATKENALFTSALSGSLQAVVETSLGTVAGALGKSAVGAGAKEAVAEKITGNLFKRLHYSGTFKEIAVRLGSEYVKENFEEGMEEVVQDLISKGAHALAAELGNYEIEPVTAEKVAKDAWENFKGGLLGSLVLGAGTSLMYTKGTIQDYAAVKKAAESIPSKEAFKKTVEASPVFAGFEKEDRSQVISDIYDANSRRRDEAIEKTAKGMEEVYTADDSMEVFAEEADENGESEEKEIPKEYRTEDGGLLTRDTMSDSPDDSGVIKGVFKVGNGDTGENYGYISYSVDNENDAVKIDAFKMTQPRDYLRYEFFADFAKRFAGYDITWDAQTTLGKQVRDSLINSNPGGSKNGLNYFNGAADIADQETRVRVAAQLREYMPNLDAKERIAAVAFLDSMAKSFGKSIAEYYGDTFDSGIFGDRQTVVDVAQAQGMQVRGGVSLRETEQGIKAVIYAAENADFSTWTHELSHVWRRQLSGDLLAQAEKAFGVEPGATWSAAQEERFAVGFEEYLRTGRAKNSALKNLYRKLAEFVSRVYGELKERINFSKEIEDVYSKLLAGDDSVLAAAERAVRLADEEDARRKPDKKTDEKKTGRKDSAMDFNSDILPEEQNAAESAQKKAESVQNAAENAQKEAENIDTEAKDIAGSAAMSDTEKDAALADLAGGRYAESRTQSILDAIDKNYGGQEAAELKRAAGANPGFLEANADNILIGEDLNNWYFLFQSMGIEGLRNLDNAFYNRQLRRAADMAKKGAARSLIQEQTGFFFDENGKLRLDVKDGTIRLPEKYTGSLTVGKIYHAPELMNAYPFLREIPVSFENSSVPIRSTITETGIVVNISNVSSQADLVLNLTEGLQKIIDVAESEGFRTLENSGGVKLETDVMELMKKAAGGADWAVNSMPTNEDVRSAVEHSRRLARLKGDVLFQSKPDNPRIGITKVRGGWTKPKILKELKHMHVPNSIGLALQAVGEYDDAADFKRHMLWHGTKNYIVGGLKPSITMTEREAEQRGGGGYGDRYWAISFTKDKPVARVFSGMERTVMIYPALLKKGAKVVELEGIEDSADLEDHIEQLWNDGVDAVWIGGGEEELAVLNPRAVVTFDAHESYAVFGLSEDKIRQLDDSQIESLYDRALENLRAHNDFKTKMAAIKWPDDFYFRKSDERDRIKKELGIADIEEQDKALLYRAKSELLFQGDDDIIAAARDFDSWEDFKAYYENSSDFKSTENAESDDRWYKDIWRAAHTEESGEAGAQESEEEKTARFLKAANGRRGFLEDFLKALFPYVNRSAEERLTKNIADALDADERAEAESELAIRDFALRELGYQKRWIATAIGVAHGHELTESMRKNLLTSINASPLPYRHLWAKIMKNDAYEVSDYDESYSELKGRAAKARLADIGEIETMGIEQRRELARHIRDKEIADAVESGEITVNDNVRRYIDNIKGQARTAERQLESLRDEMNTDFLRLTNKVQRDIYKTYERLRELEVRYETEGKKIPEKLRGALALSDKEGKYDFFADGTYNRLMKKWDALRETETISAELEKSLARIDTWKSARLQFGKLRQEERALYEINNIKKRAAKKIMRRINFDTVDYDTGKLLITAQKIFEPNIFRGINRQIAAERRPLRAIWSDFRTDEEERNRITKILTAKGSKTGISLLNTLRGIESEKDLEKVSARTADQIEKWLQKSNWIYELKLDKIARERDGDFPIDLKSHFETRPVFDDSGAFVENADVEVFDLSDDLRAQLEDFITPELFHKIQYKEFADWKLGEIEELAAKFDELYHAGRNALNARNEAKKAAARDYRRKLEKLILNTGIAVNEDDPPEVKEKKLRKIDKVLNRFSAATGTVEDVKNKSRFLNSILYSYNDANVRRVARLLDNYSESYFTDLLYWRENDCYNGQQRAVTARNDKIAKVMQDSGIKTEDLFDTVTIENLKGDGKNATFTIDALLFMKAAAINNDKFQSEQRKLGVLPQDIEEDKAFQAVVYGNMSSAKEREQYRLIDERAMEEEKVRQQQLEEARINGDEARVAELEKISSATFGMGLPGTQQFKAICRKRFDRILAEKLDGKYDALIDAILQDYSDEFEKINRASLDEFNQPVKREKYYLPIVRLSASGDTHEGKLKADLLGRMAGTGAAGTERGFTKSRVDIGALYQTPIELGLLGTWTDSVERNEHFVNYAAYVRELNRVFLNKDAAGLMQTIESRYGKGMKEYLDSYIKEVARPDADSPKSALDSAVRAMRGATAPAYLGWKVSSVLKQAVSSPAPYLQFVSVPAYVSACVKCVNPDVQQAIRDKSAFMNGRVFDPLVDLVGEAQRKATSKVKYRLSGFQKKGMAALEWIDWACVAPGWLAIYEQEYARLQGAEGELVSRRIRELGELNESRTGAARLTEEQIRTQANEEVLQDIEAAAVAKADDCVRLCQPSSRKTDLAPLFKNNSEIGKALLQFTTALNVIWQNVRYDIPYAVRNKKKRQILGIATGYAVAGIALGILADGLSGDDEDETEAFRRFLWYSTTQFTDAVPIIGSTVTDTMQKVITGKSRFSSGQNLFPTLAKVTAGIKDFSDKDWAAAAGKFAEAAALSTGLPVSGAKEAAAVFGLGDGEDGPDFYPQALLGQRK